MEISDDALVQSILGGNEPDFSVIFDRYKKSVSIEARKFLNDINEIEDICQEVFFRIYQSLRRFNPEYRLSTWIAAVTKNICIDKLRGQKVCCESMEAMSLYEYAFENDPSPEAAFINKETYRYLHSKVMELPDKFRHPIVLFYFHGLSYQEVAQILDLPLSSVKNRIYQAKARLKRKLSTINISG